VRRQCWGLICLTVLFAAPLFATSSSYQAIQQAYQQGKVSAEEKLILEVRSVKNPSSLPVQFQSSVVETQKCATDILLEAQRAFNGISASGQSALRALLARPSATFTYDSPGGKFKIHYNTSGANAVPTTDVAPANGIPDYVEWLGDYADSSFRAEVTNLGHLEPPSDGGLGGDTRYDIYTEEMGYYGYTQSEGAGPNPWTDSYSYISVHRNFSGFPPNNDPDGDQKGAAKVTVAHEYYHAIQFAYDYTEDSWFMEASSTWMENYVFDPVDDNYNYFSDWFTHPDYALNSTASLHIYAAFIWPMYLSQTFGNPIMPELWNQCITADSYPVLTSVLATHGTTFNNQFAEFCVWNFITGSRNDGNHYEEAVSYPLIKTVRTHLASAYPVAGQGPLSGQAPDALGANYVVFNLPAGNGEFTVNFNGDNSTPWIVKFLAWKAGVNDTYQETQMSLNGSGDGSYTLTNPQDFTNAVLVICNVSQSLNDRSYIYGASFTALVHAVAVTALAEDSVYSHTPTTLVFNVHNSGTALDTFDLVAGDDLGWNPAPENASVTLAAGASQAVSVAVACPPLAVAGTLDVVYLTATGRSIGGATDADTATTLVFIQPGDADNSGGINISDGVYLIAFIFSGGLAPVPVNQSGDADCNGAVNISDAVFLIAYIFSGGSPPPCRPF
jgi:hypothetical protein